MEIGKIDRLLRQVFGESADGRNALQVFVDEWKEGNKSKPGYVSHNVFWGIISPLAGATIFLSYSAYNITEDTAALRDPLLDSENTSIVVTNNRTYAAIQTPEGPQVYVKPSKSSASMTLVSGPAEASKVALSVLANFEDAKAASFLHGFPEPVQADLTVALSGDGSEIIRKISNVFEPSIYNPAEYVAQQTAIWKDVSTGIRQGSYDVPNAETLPANPKSLEADGAALLTGAFWGALLGVGGLGVVPCLRRTREKLEKSKTGPAPS